MIVACVVATVIISFNILFAASTGFFKYFPFVVKEIVGYQLRWYQSFFYSAILCTIGFSLFWAYMFSYFREFECSWSDWAKAEALFEKAKRLYPHREE